MDFGKLLFKVADIAKDLLKESAQNAEPAQKTAHTQHSEPAREIYQPSHEETIRSFAEWQGFFREILASEFADYAIRENVPVTDLAGFANDEFQLYKSRPFQAYKAEWGQPYTFVLEKDGKAAGVVMLGGGHSHDSNVKFLIARVYAKKLGLPYINFYTQMPNKRDYVIGRIHKMMG